jgi:hypothetical protein
VRLILAVPLTRYCYFSKIQFAPLGEVGDYSVADRQAQEFAGQFLPAVLAALPTTKDIDQLAATRPAGR